MTLLSESNKVVVVAMGVVSAVGAGVFARGRNPRFAVAKVRVAVSIDGGVNDDDDDNDDGVVAVVAAAQEEEALVAGLTGPNPSAQPEKRSIMVEKAFMVNGICDGCALRNVGFREVSEFFFVMVRFRCELLNEQLRGYTEWMVCDGPVCSEMMRTRQGVDKKSP